MKTLTKLLSFTLICLFLGQSAIAQKKSFEDMLKVEVRNTGPIINDKEVQGYYMFYKLDKKDRKNNNYLLRILDQNLEEVKSTRLTDGKHVRLQEASFNGVSLMMKFYDRKTKMFTFRQYDKGGAFLKKYTQKLDSKWEFQDVTLDNTKEVKGDKVFAIPNQGFANFRTIKNKKIGYSIDYYPSDKTGKKWSLRSKKESKQLEVANFLAVSENILVANIYKKKNLMTRTMDSYLVGIDTKTGKKLYELPLKDKKYTVLPVNGYFAKGSTDMVLLGQYYPLDAKVAKAKSLGLFAYTIGQDGKIKDKKYLSWKKDIAKHVSVDEKGKMKDVGYIFFHNIIETADGKILAIAEQYKKAASATGIVTSILGAASGGSGGSMSKMVTKDLMIFEFDKNFTINKVSVYEKQDTDAFLPSGSTYVSPQLLALYINQQGWFDYEYTQQNTSDEAISFTYLDYKKRKGEKDGYVFGSITYFDGEYSTDEIRLDSKKRTSIHVYPAKPGYVMIYEYNSKEKRVDLRLEKLNY